MNIIICDSSREDQQSCTTELDVLARKYGIHLQVSAFESGEQMLFHIESGMIQLPDIIYMDIALPGMDGISVARYLREHGCTSEIIFYTESKTDFSSAFDVKATNYIIKNETPPQRFEEVFFIAMNAAREKNTEYIFCAGAGECRYIPVQSILYFQVTDRIVTVYYGNESFSFYSTMGKIVNYLQDYGFVQINKHCLVVIDRIQNISNTEVLMINGAQLPVDSSYYNMLKDAVIAHSARFSQYPN